MEQEINGKVQKINDEDYEIIKKIESDGYVKAVEWYQESYDCELVEAKDTIKSIKEQYNVDIHDEDEILTMYHSNPGPLQIAKWYMETYDVSVEEAKNRVFEVLKKHNVSAGEVNGSGSGCMITILIAITSTLSVFFIL